jgi:hypothetical protein
MGMVVMSKRELNRLDVLARLDNGRLTARAAAELMAITPRQTYRLLRRYRDGGASAVANQRRGRPSNNRLPDMVRSCDCAGAGTLRRLWTTFAAEKPGRALPPGERTKWITCICRRFAAPELSNEMEVP